MTGEATSLNTERKPRRFFGLRRSAVIEIAVYLGGALLLDTLVFEGVRFREVSPHPFWPLVLLIAAQYGTTEGLLAAASATAALLAGNIPEQSFSQDIYEYLFSIIREPLLWFAASVVLGELRSRQAQFLDTLREELQVSKKRGSDLAIAYQRMNKLKDGLEARAAGQLRTAVSMFQAARQIERLDPDQVLSGVVDVIRVAMNPEKFSVYLLHRDTLEMAVQSGWAVDDDFRRCFEPSSLMFQKVISRRQFLCAANPEDEAHLDRQGLLAGPLIQAETGTVIGMLKIEQMGFLDLHAGNVQTFKVLAEWIATAYANALRYKVAQSQSLQNEETHLLSYSFLSRQMEFLVDLARRVGFDVTMLVIRLDSSDLAEDERHLVPIAFGEAVRSCLRATDLAFDYRHAGTEFSVVLPNTAVAGAKLVADKLQAKLAASLGDLAARVRFTIQIQPTFENHGTPRWLTTGLPSLAADAAPRSRLAAPQVVQWQLQFLKRLASRVGFDVLSMPIRVERLGLPEDGLSVLSDALGQILAEFVPGTGLCSTFDERSSGFLIVVPGSSDDEAMDFKRLVSVRLQELLEESGRSDCMKSVAVGMPEMGRSEEPEAQLV